MAQTNKDMHTQKREAMAENKDSGRDGRLMWTHRADTVLRQELNVIAREKCQKVIGEYAQCAQESGLMVVFKCRKQNVIMNECLHLYTNEEEFLKYKTAKEHTLVDNQKKQLE